MEHKGVRYECLPILQILPVQPALHTHWPWFEHVPFAQGGLQSTIIKSMQYKILGANVLMKAAELELIHICGNGVGTLKT